MHEQDTEAERQRKEAQWVEALANKRTLAELRLQRERDAERREREQREAEASQRQAEFERRWLRWATDGLFDWLTFEQRQAVLRMVEETVAAHSLEDEDLMRRILTDSIARFCVSWKLEREALAKREELIEETARRLPYGATDAERARAATDTRAALSQIPLSARDLEIRAADAGAVAPIVKIIEERNAVEKTRQEAEWEAKRRKWRKDDLIRAGVAHVSGYLLQLRIDKEIDEDAFLDVAWQRELEKDVREALQAELTGSEEESKADAQSVAEEIVDAALE